jgi:hypothetical protein
MKKQVKPLERKSKDKKPENLECYESTLVNEVVY